MTSLVLTVLLLPLTVISPASINTSNGGTKTELYTSEKIERANENIVTSNTAGSHLTYGDIMVDMIEDGGVLRNAVTCTASSCKWPKNKKNKVKIPYEITSDFSKKEANFIKKILKGFKKSTCIRFIKKKSKHRDYLSFISADGCWSYLGRTGNRQQISLKSQGCLFTDIVQHEVLHALGFHHEHVRSDRDDHVEINFDNIQPGVERNFELSPTNNLGTPYDFQSVMHYSPYAFSVNGQRTITAKNNSITNFGNAVEMSVNDYARVKRLYEC
ncbi:hatching enzyme 1.2-like [Dunckerocampus dactyliophorus]|uniref:hatching enzyme 1.2-like n=1 Tax=Dunckerocampus dactyliophorus TaxID=161453 RepID=UPI00240569D0|nr:hatching enzyme 1.2-like [Dunckerocampus dactyliophorus]